MRLRILTVPPLPNLKAWFSTKPLGGPSATVVDLKRDICSRVQSLKDAQIHGNDIALVLDDFDLLNESSIDVVRDGDLICIKPLPGTKSTKRKTLHDDSPSGTFKRTEGSHPEHVQFLRANSLSEQKSRPSESTSGSVSSSSDSESSTSSEDSDTDSSTSGCSSPQPQSAKISSAIRGAVGKPITAPLVPPGQGKHTTQSRNIRRRVKKQHERNGGPAGAAPTGSSVTNTQPLGLKQADEDTSRTVDGDALMASNPETTVMMSSLGNKNKKKGFKNSMAKPLPKKIIFSSTDDNREPASSTALSSAITDTASTAQVGIGPSLPQLVPPSEKEDLPPNIFVTVVDVEEELPSKKKRRQRRETYAADEDDDGGKCWLNYGAAGAETVEVDGAVNVTGVDFERAEKQWESFLVISELSQLKSDTVVGWKALAINPSTFTPEILLNLAVVSSCNGHEVIARPLHRPGATQVMFGGTLEQENIEQESYEWLDVVSSQWRIVSTTLGHTVM